MKKMEIMWGFEDVKKVSDFIWAIPNMLPDIYKIVNPVLANDEMYGFQKLNNDVLVTRVFLDKDFFTVPCYRKQEVLLSSIENPEFKNYLKSLMN